VQHGNPAGRHARWSTAASLVILLDLAQFVVVWLVAMARYPGGNPWNLHAPGYSFWRNTLSDLTASVADDGRPNGTYRSFMVSLGLLAPAMLIAWLHLPRLFARYRRLGRTVRILGWLSAAGLVWVATAPANLDPRAHVLAIGASSLPAAVGLALACAGLFLGRAVSRCYAWFTGGLLAVVWLQVVQYLYSFWLGGTWSPAMPAMEKVAALYVLAWLSASAILWGGGRGLPEA
jgi:hypothetical protein